MLLIGLLGTAAGAQPGGLAPVPATTVAVEAPDHAIEVHGDPWDYANPEDVHTWAPAVWGATAALADGRLRLDVPGPGGGHAFLLFPGFDGAVPTGRDGGAAPLDATRHRTAVLRIHASAPVTAAVVTRTCPGVTAQCDRYADLQLKPGWHTYTTTLPDSGAVHGVRLAVAAGPVTLQVDWVRLLAGPIDHVPVAAAGQVFWDADADPGNNTSDRPGWGPVEGGRFPAGAMPAGTYRFYTAGGDGSAGDRTRSPLSTPLHVLARPQVRVLDPDAAGGEDFITAATGDPWDFDQAGDAVAHESTAVTTTGGVLSGTSTSNDPFAVLRMAGRVMDPARHHRLTVTFGLDGVFDLGHGPGGGAMARLLWSTQDPALLRWVDGNDIVAYPNAPTHTVDLDHPLAVEEGVAARWRDAPVTAVRVDPHEDPGARRWHLDEVRIAADDATRAGGFDVTFEDPSADLPAPSGTTTRYEVRADTDRVGHDGRVVASGTATGRRTVARWDTAGVTPGTYHLHVRVIRQAGGAQAVTDTYATGPLVVRPEDTTGAGAAAEALRIAGPTRYETAVELAREAFPDGASTAVVVTGEAFPDALAAAPLATAFDGPVLLSARTALPRPTAAALTELGVRRVVLLGGAAAIDHAVEADLRGRGLVVERISGSDRFATAAAVAERMADDGAVRSDEVVLAYGGTFTDALAGGWRAATTGAPLLLLDRAGATPATVAALRRLGSSSAAVGRAVVVGDEATIGESAFGTVRSAGLSARRIAGATPWATAAAVVRSTPGLEPTGVLVASGQDYPDALAAGPAAAVTGRLLVLTGRDGLPAESAALLADHGDRPGRVVGGAAAVAGPTLRSIAALLGVG